MSDYPLRQVISVLSGKGGVGKTTISASLGCHYAASGLKTLVIDLDMGLRNLDLYYQTQGDVVFDVSHVLDGFIPLSEAVVQIPGYKDLYMLASSLQKSFSVIDIHKFQQLLSQAKEEFDLVILDAPAGADPLLVHLVARSDAALLVSNPYTPSLRSIDKLLGIIDKSLPTFWILNKVPQVMMQKSLINNIKSQIDFPLSGIIDEMDEINMLQAHQYPLNHKNATNFIKKISKIAPLLIGLTANISIGPDDLIEEKSKPSFLKKVRDFVIR